MKTPRSFLTALCLLGVASVAVSETSPSPSPSPASGDRVAGGITRAGPQAGWKGLYPGRSRKADVIGALGEPVSTGAYNAALTQLVYGPDADLKYNSVFTDAGGLVKKVGWARWAEADRVTFKDLVGAFGEPVMKSSHSFLTQGQIYNWPNAGVWGVADKPTGLVLTLIFYDPKEPVEIPVPTDSHQ